MNWTFPLQFHLQPQGQEYPTHFNPIDYHLMLHIIRQNSLLSSQSLPFLNSPVSPYPYQPLSNWSQLSLLGQYHNQHQIVNQFQNIEQEMRQLKKQQGSSGPIERSNLQQNLSQHGEQGPLHFNSPHPLAKPRNLISHNSSLRNDTKNIPKNYGKAMLTYIQKNAREVKEILHKHQVDYLQFMIFVKSFKSKINTMHDLREMWGEKEFDNKFKKCTRVLSYHFMRKKCLPYIFNSRIKNFHTHIKYRKKIMEGIENPQNFTKIKQF